jgi:hypothetical protein
MIVTITSLKLRSLFGFFRLSLHGLRISRQAKSEPGFVKMKNTGSGYTHYTLTAWESEADLKRFSRTGAHLDGIKQGKSLAREIRIFTFPSDSIPDWKEAKRLVAEKGRVISY